VIVARASNPTSIDTLVRAGADQVVSPYLLSGWRMAFLARHPAVVDFLDLMSIVPDLRLEQILVRTGSVLDGTTVAAASAACRDATILAIRRASGEPISYRPGDRVGRRRPCRRAGLPAHPRCHGALASAWRSR
jgi:voltage-gated potassium channel